MGDEGMALRTLMRSKEGKVENGKLFGRCAMPDFVGPLILIGVIVLIVFLCRDDRAARIREQMEFSPSPVHGTARFASDDDLEDGGMFGEGIRLGYSQESGTVIRHGGPGHLLTVAPSRSGKARDVLVPVLLEKGQGSIICLDGKGQLCAITAVHRRDRLGQVVVALDPFGIAKSLCGVEASRYNPMATLVPGSRTLGVRSDKIADGLIWNEHERENHWTESAKELVSGIMMALAEHGAPHEKNLAALREVIGGDVFGFCREAMKSPNRFIRQKLSRYAAEGAEDNKEISGIISTAKTQTAFIGNEIISDSLSDSDFSFADLRQKATTVYLILPLDDLDVCGKWFRLIFASALSELLRDEGRGLPVLAILDEFAQLGALKAIENAMAMAAGFRLQLWPVLQDLTQLKKLYRESWETFLSNTGVRMFFRPNDKTTSEYLSDLTGQCEVLGSAKSVSYRADTNWTVQGQEPQINTNFSQMPRKLMLPDEVRQLNATEMLLFSDSVSGVVRAGRWPYYATAEFDGLYSPDPYHAETGADEESEYAEDSPAEEMGWFSWLWR